MLLRMSTLFLRTLRDDPADAEVPSHRLLVRGGYVRRVAPGIFTWLPLGVIVLRKIEEIVRAQMTEAGFQEVHFPSLLPREPYEATGRWTEYGPTLFTLKDRRESDFLLGPTHEEMFTLLVKSEYSSYKDLPVSLFQIQTKYRDEARPRAGILRGREFVMKDSYSFDYTDEGLVKSYQDHRDAYIKTFDELGLEYVIASATSGAMGGSASEEFLAPCESGEDTFVRCSACEYAANVEAVATSPRQHRPERNPAPADFETVGLTSIADVVELLNAEPPHPGGPWSAADLLKHMAFVVTHPDESTEALVVGLPADREVDVKRLEAALSPATVKPFEEADFAAHPGLRRGYLGPIGLGRDSELATWYLLDASVGEGSEWVAGANRTDWHTRGLRNGRDFVADGSVEAAEVRAGDPCPTCGSALEIARGVEIGHIFQLGRKYAEALDLKVLNENGKQVVVTMGSYGIGVSRAVAAIAEQSYDERGLIWPRQVSPADVHVVLAGKQEELKVIAERVVSDLVAHDVSVLFDDRRQASPGVKFKDAELLGIPTIVVVGKRALEGVVGLRDRRSMESTDVPIAETVTAVLGTVNQSS